MPNEINRLWFTIRPHCLGWINAMGAITRAVRQHFDTFLLARKASDDRKAGDFNLPRDGCQT